MDMANIAEDLAAGVVPRRGVKQLVGQRGTSTSWARAGSRGLQTTHGTMTRSSTTTSPCSAPGLTLADAMEIEREGEVDEKRPRPHRQYERVSASEDQSRRQLRHVSQQQAAEPDADEFGGTKDGVARSGPTGRFPQGQLPVRRPALSDFRAGHQRTTRYGHQRNGG